MKRLYYILLLSVLSTTVIQAQDLYIKFKSGATVSYGLSTVDRITFFMNDMQVHVFGIGIQNYNIGSIAYYKYRPVITGVETTNTTSAADKLKLYPNPTSGMVQVAYSLSESSEIDIRLYSLSGQQVLLRKESAIAGEQQLSLDLGSAGIPPGVYFLELISSKERLVNKLIFK